MSGEGGAASGEAGPAGPRAAVREALRLLGIRRLLLGAFDAAFPAAPGEDVGRGVPASPGGTALLALAAELGFDGLQLGPQGLTAADDPSPYDGAFFSRDPLSVPLAALARPEGGALLSAATLEELVRARPAPADRAAHAFAWRAAERALDEAWGALRSRLAAGEGGAVGELGARLRAFRAAGAEWLERDALYDALARAQGGASWRHWRGPGAELDRRLLAPAPGEEDAAALRRGQLLRLHDAAVDRHAFAQLLAHEAHGAFRARARSLGLALFGDLQVGMSERDAWASQGFTLRDYRMGAPPSRTNPEGQAWGYPVLDPRRYREGGGDGPALRALRARVRKALAEYDGLRIDHPHGLVTPWVYRVDGGAPHAAVRAGARLFSSPDLPDHPALAELAIARPAQLRRDLPRHHDGWVRELEDAQVARYAVLVDAVMDEARRAGLGPDAVPCEILSTQPYPLRRVIERHGLGRFRVTQKADLARADDVYRGENARPEDWILLGNHDTPTLWALADRWVASGASRAQAEYLATRLLPDGEDRRGWIAATAADATALVHAKAADLFVGPARQVLVFFTDLLGEREPYNAPGTVAPANWSRRMPADLAAAYRDRRAAGQALDLRRALAAALRARGPTFARAQRELLRALDGDPR